MFKILKQLVLFAWIQWHLRSFCDAIRHITGLELAYDHCPVYIGQNALCPSRVRHRMVPYRLRIGEDGPSLNEYPLEFTTDDKEDPDNVDVTTGNTNPSDPFIYIVAVLSFYVIVIVLLMIKSIHEENAEEKFRYSNGGVGPVVSEYVLCETNAEGNEKDFTEATPRNTVRVYGFPSSESGDWSEV